MNEAFINGLVYVLGVAFVAGGLFWQVSAIRRDLNGMGAKANEDRKAAFRRYHNASLAMMLIAKPEDQKQITVLLREDE